jgi:hypothetical protein
MKSKKLVLANIVPIKQNYLVMAVDGKFYYTDRMPANADQYAALIDTINNSEWVNGLWLPLCRLGEQDGQ